MIKSFLHKLRSDLASLRRYPTVHAGVGFSIDYDIYWHRRGGIKDRGLSAWQRERADLALQFIDEGSTVLDLGAGDGAMLAYFRDHKHIRPIGIEVSKESIEAIRGSGIEAVEADICDPKNIEALPQVDYITGFEILEHMPNPEALLHALRPKARKGMLFSFPNTGYYAHRLRLLFGRFPLQWVAHPGEHVRFWTAADVRSWVPQTGLVLYRLVLYQGLPGLNRIWPSLFGQGIFIALKNPDM